MLVLRVHERFGMDPFGPWWPGLSPGRQTLLLAYERVRSGQEARA